MMEFCFIGFCKIEWFVSYEWLKVGLINWCIIYGKVFKWIFDFVGRNILEFLGCFL